MTGPATEQYQDIREAVRALCAGFPDEYHRKIDEQRGYPEAFVDALTKAGWLAAMIPQEYGGSGLGLTEASVIMEEMNRSAGNALLRTASWSKRPPRTWLISLRSGVTNSSL